MVTNLNPTGPAFGVAGRNPAVPRTSSIAKKCATVVVWYQ